MTPVRLQPLAVRDLRRISGYLALQSESGELGERFLDVAAETAALLAKAPLLGRLRISRNPHLNALRSLALKRPFDRYLFYYQIGEAGLVVVRVLHAAQSAYHLLSLEPETKS